MTIRRGGMGWRRSRGRVKLDVIYEHDAMSSSLRSTRSKHLVMAVLLPLVTLSETAAQDFTAQGAFALTHVAVIDGTGAALKLDQTVVVAQGRITAVGSSASVSVPEGIRVLNAPGKFLIPGLWDLHVHTRYQGIDHLRLSITNGITSVRDMGGPWQHLSEIQQWRDEIAKGERMGPRIWAAGPLLDGPESQWSHAAKIANAEEGRQTVRRLKSEGADFVKVYDLLSRDSFFAIADEAKLQGLTFVGHVPLSISVLEAADAGQRSIEHLQSIVFELAGGKPEKVKSIDISGRQAQAIISAMRKNHTAFVPTFSLYSTRAGAGRNDPSVVAADRLRYIPSQYRTEWTSTRPVTPAEVNDAILDKGSELTRALHAQGVEILAGTDVVKPFFVPGFGLQDELPLLVKAGLSEMESLQAATRGPARFMGIKDLGTVEPGMLADLVLLDANPLLKIENTRKIRAVVSAGRLLGRREMDDILNDVELSARAWKGTPTGR
jgi:imidazolonepropionase-like amidohydrolase